MQKRIGSLIRKEFIQIRRDKRTLVMMVAIPLIWIVLFGYAATFDVHEHPGRGGGAGGLAHGGRWW